MSYMFSNWPKPKTNTFQRDNTIILLNPSSIQTPSVSITCRVMDSARGQDGRRRFEDDTNLDSNKAKFYRSSEAFITRWRNEIINPATSSQLEAFVMRTKGAMACASRTTRNWRTKLAASRHRCAARLMTQLRRSASLAFVSIAPATAQDWMFMTASCRGGKSGLCRLSPLVADDTKTICFIV